MPDAPTIPRFWWLTRLTILLVVIVVGVTGFHLWFTRHAEARQAALVDSWRGDGRPHPDDAARNTGAAPNRPDNAAFLIEQVITTFPPMTQRQDQLYMLDDWFPLPEESVADVAALEASHATTFALIRDARDLPESDWGLYAGDHTLLLPHLNSFREAANRLYYALPLRHRDGDIAAAIEYARDILTIGEAVPTYSATVLTSLVATSIHRLAAERLRDMALTRPPGMSAEQEAAAWRDARPQVEAAIRDLLDPVPERAVGRLGFAGERNMNVLTADWMLSPGGNAGAFGVPILDGPVGPAITPVIRLDMLGLAGRLDRTSLVLGEVDALPDQRDALAAAGTSLEPPVATGVAEASSGLLTSIMGPSLDRALVAYARVKADRRAAAVMLAAKLYAADHEGELPPSLDALVPEYLPHVPLDPFARGNRPMRYDPDAPLPIVYSVGEDFEDDGGCVVPTDLRRRRTAKNGGVDSHQHEKEDVVYPLRPSPLPFVDEMNYLFDGGRALVGDRPLVPASLLIP